MKKQLKKPFLMMAVTALVLVGTLKVGGAMAYFTTYSTASGSVQMNMGFTQTIPHEEVDSRGKHVSVENTGDYDCFVRVRAFAPSDITLSYQPEDSGWTDGGDGFWYYDQILPAGETTATKLNVSYTFPATDSEDAPAEFNVIVVEEYTPVLYKADGTAYADWNNVITADTAE